MALDKKQKLLIGLVSLLAVVLAYRLVRPFRQQTVSKLTYARTNRIAASPTRAAGRDDASRPTKIKIDLMARPPQLELKIYRDPFRRPVPQAAARSAQTAPKKPPPPVVTPEERAKEKLRRFKAFGSFQQGDRTSLFLQRGKQVLVVNVGDRIDGKFKIEAIDGFSVVVSSAETPTPFQFEFEELKSDDTRPFASSTTSAGGPPDLTRRPPNAPPPESRAASLPPDLPEDIPSEDDEDRPPPSLPKPPPTDSPAQPFKSDGSPSRSYLPGTKPAE